MSSIYIHPWAQKKYDTKNRKMRNYFVICIIIKYKKHENRVLVFR